MDDKFKLVISTPDRKVFDGDVKDLTTENDLGKFEILSNHTALITSLVPTVTTFTSADDRKLKLFTSTGVLKVQKNTASLLCETAEWPDEIDVDRAEEAKKKAEQLLKEKQKTDYKKAEFKLKRALARIKAKD